MALQSRRVLTGLAYGGLTAGVFALDWVTPLGLNVPILYLVPLLIAFLLEDIRTRVGLTLAATLLTIAVIPLKSGDTWTLGIINRSFDLAVFAVALALSIRDAWTTSELRDLRAALDNASLVVVTDAKGIITDVNDRFCEIAHYSKAELIGRDYHIVNAATQPAAQMRAMWSTLGAGRVWHGEMQQRAKDGGVYWVDTTIVPFLGTRGQPYQYLAIHADITGHKQAEARLRNQAALARLGEMAAIVAHEVRNPLAGVRAGLQLLTRRPTIPPDERVVIGRMVERLDLLNAHVTDLLQFARPRTARAEVLAMRPLLEDVAKLLFQNGAWPAVRCDIVGHDAPVVGDEIMLREVFTNLLVNAAQAIEGSGQITVSLQRAAGGVDVVVTDSGGGIAEPLRERVFEPFFTTKKDGTGLGLSIVKQFVELHGGEIEIMRTGSPGTSIKVTLPAAHDEEGARLEFGAA
jgi:PAS domain S-box-containing protein